MDLSSNSSWGCPACLHPGKNVQTNVLRFIPNICSPSTMMSPTTFWFWFEEFQLFLRTLLWVDLWSASFLADLWSWFKYDSQAKTDFMVMESNILMKPVTLAGINEMALPNYTTSNVAYELWLKCTYLYLLVFPPCWTIRSTARHSHSMGIMSSMSVSSSPWAGLTDLTTAQWGHGLELICSDLSVLGWGGTLHTTQGSSPEYVERL